MRSGVNCARRPSWPYRVEPPNPARQTGTYSPRVCSCRSHQTYTVPQPSGYGVRQSLHRAGVLGTTVLHRSMADLGAYLAEMVRHLAGQSREQQVHRGGGLFGSRPLPLKARVMDEFLAAAPALVRLHSTCQKEWKNVRRTEKHRSTLVPLVPYQRRHWQSGEEHLPGAQLSELEEMHRRERPGKSRDKLQAAVLRKRDRTLWKMIRIMGRGVSTAHGGCPGWSEGLDGKHDGKSPGRPRLLNPVQEKVSEGDLGGTPREGGFGRSSRNVGTVTRRILDRFCVPCSWRSAVRLRTGLDSRSESRRSAPYDGVMREGHRECKDGRTTAAYGLRSPRVYI